MRTPTPDGFIQPESANKFAQILDALDPPTCSLNSILKDISYKRMEGVEKYFSKKLCKRRTLSEVDLPLKASVLAV